MAYMDLEPKSQRILDALKDLMLGINGPNYFSTVRHAAVHDSERLVLGTVRPYVAVVGVEDRFVREYVCNRVERHAVVELVGAIDTIPGSDQWKRDAARLKSDMERAVALAPKLPTSENTGGEALWIEVLASEVYDQGDVNLAMAHLTLRVAYRHDKDDPTST